MSNLQNLSITRHWVEKLTKVMTFLDGVGRSSHHSKKAYHNGIAHFQDFLKEKYPIHTVETILQPLSKNEIDVYELLDSFVPYLIALKLSVKSIMIYLTAIRSFLAYYDVDVIPSKYRRRVKVPKLYREDEEPIDVKDIRKILLSCNNRRIKTYLLILASGGMRATEALAIRLRDIDFSVSPTKIHIRKEFSKTRTSRGIYISDEATQYLKQWIDWKYRDKGNEWTKTKNPDDLVFNVYKTANEPNPHNLYFRVITEFERLLSVAGMDERKEGMKRRKITLHSFRRYVKSVISNQVNQDYSEWFLGHSKSPYYIIKESERREIYTNKCMKYLTFLDYSTLEATGKNIEAKLSEKEKEIQQLKQYQEIRDDAMSSLSDQVAKLMQEIAIMKKQK